MAQPYGSIQTDDVMRLKELEHENTRLKRIVADQILDIAASKHSEMGKFSARHGAVGRVQMIQGKHGFF